MDVSYLSLVLTSIAGGFLFFGFTFRAKTVYPLNLVKIHMVLSAVTVVLFTVVMLEPARFTAQHGPFGFLDVTYGFFVLTFVTGFSFFLRFDMRRRQMRPRILGFHLVMAVSAFCLYSAVVVAYGIPPSGLRPTQIVNGHDSSWYTAQRHRGELERLESDYPGFVPLGDEPDAPGSP